MPDSLRRRFRFDLRHKDRCFNQSPYGLPLAQWNDTLKAEFAAYRTWRVEGFNPDRPRRLQQRASTFDKSIGEFENYFGYLVQVRGENANDLRLANIADPKRMREYITWHAQTRTNGPSRYMQRSVGDFYRIARYYLNAPVEQWSQLERFEQSFTPDTKRDKRVLRVPLSTLEQIGEAEHPDRAALRRASTSREKLLLALRAQRSLIVKLLVRRPLRSRNIREMKLGRNLYQEGKHWIIEFRGDELKVDRRKGRQNVYRISFPRDLEPRLNEFLTVWRPLLPGHDLPEVFTVWTGRPFTGNALNTELKKLVHAYTGKAMNIHLFRDAWSSEFLANTHDLQDVVTAAIVLGDDVDTVLACYADVQKFNAGAIVDRRILRVIGGRKKRKAGRRHGGDRSAV